MIVDITLTYSPTRANAMQLLANPDGTWSGNVDFTFSGVGKQAKIDAECVDWQADVVYAHYQTGHTRLSSP